MTTHSFALFDTPLGACGLVWSPRGVAAVQLPEAQRLATRARILEHFPQAREAALTSEMDRVRAEIVALLRGQTSQFESVVLDMEGISDWGRRVYEVARTIAPGTTLSYGEIAARLKSPGAARAVGAALGRNPFLLIVPCHRVIAANGKLGGFSAHGGLKTKRRLLAIESALAASPLIPFNGSGGLGFDTAVAERLVSISDPALGRMIEAVGPCQLRLKVTMSVFGALAESIIHQQLATRAAMTIYSRVCALFPQAPAGPTPPQILRVSDEGLRAAGVSRNKIAALRDLAQRVESGELPTMAKIQRMDDEAIVEQLTRVRGIGRWTVEMFLIFRLGRPDVLPLDDYGVRKGFSLALGRSELPSRRELEAHGERWRPYRTVASWYLWRAVEQESVRRNTASTAAPELAACST
jgi:methylated-DNA-[protein]-cysteine S-methyltransferase